MYHSYELLLTGCLVTSENSESCNILLRSPLHLTRVVLVSRHQEPRCVDPYLRKCI